MPPLRGFVGSERELVGERAASALRIHRTPSSSTHPLGSTASRQPEQSEPEEKISKDSLWVIEDLTRFGVYTFGRGGSSARRSNASWDSVSLDRRWNTDLKTTDHVLVLPRREPLDSFFVLWIHRIRWSWPRSVPASSLPSGR